MNSEESRPSLVEELDRWLPRVAIFISIVTSVLPLLSPTQKFIAISIVVWGLSLYLRVRRNKPVLQGSTSGSHVYSERVRFGALIGLIGIPAFMLGTFLSPIIRPTPANSVTTSVSITKIEGSGSTSIEVPYAVLVKGTASISEGLYVYLIVNDGNAEYIQPAVARSENGSFVGYVYLGVENDPSSINKRYSIYAVLTDKEYGTNARLDSNSIKAISNTIDLYRTP